MTDTRKIQLGVEVDATKARDGFAQVTQAGREMSEGLKQSSDKARKGMEGMGGGSEKAAKDVDKNTKSIISSIQRTTAAMEAGERGTSKYFEALANQRGANTDALKPYLDQLDAATKKQEEARLSLGRVGVSAGQTAAAMRQVPAQFTDIVTSLQAGQAPLTVLLQQGGQLKDSFGGAGAAAKALGGYIVGLVNPFSLAAAAAGVAALAYYQGSKEAEAYAKAIIMTGNASGVTVGQLQATAKAISEVTGATQGAAAGALAQVVATGKVAAENVQQIAAVALAVEKTTGQAVSKTVDQFAELGKAPVEAAVKLNEQYNFLTASVFKQIKALEDEGRTSDAASAAQKALADSLAARAQAITANLGTIERGWAAITGTAKGAWDAMLGIGRAESNESKLAATQKRIAELQNTTARGGFGQTAGGAATGGGQSGFDTKRQAELANLQAQAAVLQGLVSAEQEAAKAAADKADNEQLAIQWMREGDKYLTKQQQLKKEIARAEAEGQRLLAAGLINQAEYAERLRNIRDKGTDGTGQSEVAGIRAKILAEQQYIAVLKERGTQAVAMTEGEKLVLKLQQELGTSLTSVARAQKEKALSAAQELVTAEKQRVAEEKRIKGLKDSEDAHNSLIQATGKEAEAIRQQAAELEAANLVWGKGKTAVEQYKLAQLEAQMQSVDSTDAADARFIAQLQAKIDAQKRYVEALKEADYKSLAQKQEEYTRQVAEEARLYEDEVGLLGLTAREREKVVAIRKVELALAKQLAEIERSGVTGARRQELIESAEAAAEQAKATAAARVDLAAMTDILNSVDRTAQQVWTNIFQGGSNAFKKIGEVIKASVLDLLYQLTLKKWVIGITAEILGSLGLDVAGSAVRVAGSAVGSAAGSAASGAAGGAAGSAAGGAASSGVPMAAIGSEILKWFTDFGKSIGLAINKIGVAVYKLGAEQIGGALMNSAATVGQYLETFGNALGYVNSVLAISKGKWGEGIGGAVGTYFGGPLGSFIGSKIGAWVDRMFAGESRSGGQYAVAYDGKVQNNRRGETYTYEDEYFQRPGPKTNKVQNGQAYRIEADGLGKADDDIRKAVAGTAAGINATLAALGSKLTLTGYWAGLETSGRGRGGVFAGGSLSDGTKFGEDGKGDNYAGTLYEKWSTQSPDMKTAVENFSLDLKQSTIQALQAASDIPEVIKEKLKGVDAEALTNEAADALLKSINDQIIAVQGLRSVADALPMKNLKDLSFDAASGLIALAGGLDKLTSQLSSYYQNYYSEDERKAQTLANIGKSLGAVGLSVPKTREEFRKLVESQDLTTEAGRKAYAVLMAVADAFAEVTPAAEDAAKAAKAKADADKAAAEAAAKAQAEALRAATDAAYSALERSINAQKTAAQAAAQVAQESVNTLTTIFNLLKSNVTELYASVEATQAASAAAGRQFIDNALQTARTTGYMPDSTALGDAISAARTGLDSSNFTSATDQRRAQLVLAGKLAELQGIAGVQKTLAQQQLDAANAQIKGLDQILENAKRQLDALRGIDTSVISVADAVDRFAAAMQAEKENQAAANSKKPGVSETGTGPGGAQFTVGGGGSGGKPPAPNTVGYGAEAGRAAGKYWAYSDLGPYGTAGYAVTDKAQIEKLNGVWDYAFTHFDPNNLGVLADKAKAEGWTQLDYAAATGFDPADIEKMFAAGGIPKFARGGFHSGGLALVGEEGPELVNFRAPVQITNASKTRELFAGGDSGEMAAELRALREQITDLQHHTKRTADATNGNPEGGAVPIAIMENHA